MNYKLAKQLKDAGFPQTGRGNWFIENYDVAQYVTNFENKELLAYAPTLSELIEAVIGNKPNTFDLEYNQEWAVYEPPNNDGPWAARYYDLTPVGFYLVGSKTPDEAVAKLWLALNKPLTMV